MTYELRAIHERGPVRLALRWATRTAEKLPAAQGSQFRSERVIAADALCEMLEKRGRPNPREESIRLVRAAWERFVQHCSLQPDVSAAWLRGLRSHVAGLGLVTDGDTEAVTAVLAHAGLVDIFDSTTISEHVRAYKPNPRIYHAALEALGAKPSESLFVSDSALDLQGAVNFGMAAAWIRRGLMPELAEPPRGVLVSTSVQDVERVVGRYAKAGEFALR